MRSVKRVIESHGCLFNISIREKFLNADYKGCRVKLHTRVQVKTSEGNETINVTYPYIG